MSASSGYPLRYEDDEGGAVTFHSWGATEPIAAPDMDCVDPTQNVSGWD